MATNSQPSAPSIATRLGALQTPCYGDRYAWLQIAQGVASLNGEELRAGDGVQINGEEQLQISTETGTELLLFDLA